MPNIFDRMREVLSADRTAYQAELNALDINDTQRRIVDLATRTFNRVSEEAYSVQEAYELLSSPSNTPSHISVLDAIEPIFTGTEMEAATELNEENLMAAINQFLFQSMSLAMQLETIEEMAEEVLDAPEVEEEYEYDDEEYDDYEEDYDY